MMILRHCENREVSEESIPKVKHDQQYVGSLKVMYEYGQRSAGFFMLRASSMNVAPSIFIVIVGKFLE